MSEQNPLPPSEDQVDPETRIAELEEQVADLQKAVTEQPAGGDVEAAPQYAVYDLTHHKFVGPVTARKPSAKDAKALVGDHDYEIREV